MEKLASILSVAVAGCFVGSAAFLYGQALGLGHQEIIWLLTISDILNRAPGTLLVYGASFAFFFHANFSMTKGTAAVVQGKPLRVFGAVVLVTAVTIALAVFFQDAFLAFVPAFAILNIPLLLRAQIVAATGELGYKVLDVALWAVCVMIMLGLIFGKVSLHGHGGVKVVTAQKTECATASIVLDRGVVLVRGDSYELVPWNSITSMAKVRQIEVVVKPNQKPDSCFGMI